MAAQLSKSVDIQYLVKNIFADRDWMVKTGIGGVIAAASLVAILYNYIFLPVCAALWAVMVGYWLRCMRHKCADVESKLPEWNEWGDLFMSGITWIAIQSVIFALTVAVSGLILVNSTGIAFLEKSTRLSFLWIVLPCMFVFVSSAILSLTSAYTMVNFAVEENAKAGLAYRKIVRRLLKFPRVLITGFLLATGIQWLSIILPCLTIIGVFLIPSSFFIGQVVASVVLARHWTATESIESES